MRLSVYCLLALGALTGGVACGEYDGVARPRPQNGGGSTSATSGGVGGTKGNPVSGTGGSGGTIVGSGGSSNTGGSNATGGSGGNSGSTSGTTTTGSGGAGSGSNTGGSGGGSSTGGSAGTGGGSSTGGSAGTGGSNTGGSGGSGTAKDAGAGGSGSTGGSTVADAGIKVDANGGSVDAGTPRIDAIVSPPSDSGSSNAGLWIAPNHPCYEWDKLPASQVPWQHITHLGLGYVQPKLASGKYTLIEAPGWSTGWSGFRDTALGFADAAHAASRKAFMMVGAAQSNTGDYAGVWNSATSSANVDAFADTIVATLKDMHIDGVELDWEEDINYPQLVSLAQKIRTRWADGLIFIDVMPLDDASFAALASAKNDVDAFMPMTFLAIPQWGGWVLPIPLSPLYGYSGNGYSIDDNLKSWTSAGVPASKVIMGVGGFGSVWGDSNNDKTAPIAPYITVNGSGGANSETADLYNDGVVTQAWVNSLVSGNASMVEGWDDIGKTSYWHAPATNTLVATQAQSKAIQASLVFYETPRSMTEKLNYAKAQGMRGMNFWTLNQTIDKGASPILETIMP